MKVTALHRKVRAMSLMAFALIAGLSQSARAQTDPAANYPNKTIKIVVGFAAGNIARAIYFYAPLRMQNALLCMQSEFIQQRAEQSGRRRLRRTSR